MLPHAISAVAQSFDLIGRARYNLRNFVVNQNSRLKILFDGLSFKAFQIFFQHERFQPALK